jgi:hypothetical protein
MKRAIRLLGGLPLGRISIVSMGQRRPKGPEDDGQSGKFPGWQLIEPSIGPLDFAGETYGAL